MSTFRGFDTYLISRVSRAGGHYFDESTLRFFNAYGGTHARIDESRTLVVESVEHPSAGRIYRVILVRFYQDATGRERVDVERVTGDASLTRSQAGRVLSKLTRDALPTPIPAHVADVLASGVETLSPDEEARDEVDYAAAWLMVNGAR